MSILVMSVLAFSNSARSRGWETVPVAGGTSPALQGRAPFLPFVEEIGPHPTARFALRGPNSALYVADDGLWLAAFGSRQMAPFHDRVPRGINLRLFFVGANPDSHPEPFQRLGTKVSSLVGNNPAEWRRDIPAWGSVRYREIYPGLDLEVAGNGGRWTWRAVVREPPRFTVSKAQQVRLRIEGADAIAPETHRLRITTPAGELSLPLPQLVDGAGRPLKLTGIQSKVEGNEIAAPFAPSPLEADAIQSASSSVIYSTFLGGSELDQAHAAFLDSAGYVYVTGETGSGDFPTSPGAFDPVYNGLNDAFVAKLNPEGTGIVWVTFIGGSLGRDYGDHLFVNEEGRVYVNGTTYASDFPATPNAFHRSRTGPVDAFVSVLSSDGAALDYATYLGGSSSDWGGGIAVDGAGNVYVTGQTLSSDFPATAGAFDPTFNGSYDAYVARFTPGSTALDYSTYLGGSGDDRSVGMALDGAGCAYVIGATSSVGFPTTMESFDTGLDGPRDGFVTKLEPDGTGLVYSSLVGGSSWDVAASIVVDDSGSAYIAGYTESSDFPVTPGAFDTGLDGYTDAYAIKMTPDGSALEYATYLGGSGLDLGYGIAIDPIGNAYVTGSTYSVDFPTTPDAFDTQLDGDTDIFIAKLDPHGGELQYGSYLGGSSSEQTWGDPIRVSYPRVLVVGWTSSPDFPTTPGAFRTEYGGGTWDSFLVELAASPGMPLAENQRLTVETGSTTYIQLRASDPDGDRLAYSIVSGPSHGTLGGAGDEWVTYTPEGGFAGEDAFTFKVNDGVMDSNVATVSITVTANHRPWALGQSIVLQHGETQRVELKGSDSDGDPLTFAIVSGPSHGSLSEADDRDAFVTYHAQTGYVGQDAFTFKVNDGFVDSPNEGTVSVTILAVHQPAAYDQRLTVETGSTTYIQLRASDPDGDRLAYSIVSGPSHGTLAGADDGDEQVTYTPEGGFEGEDAFTFKVNDGVMDSNVATVSITVTAVSGDAPTAQDQIVTVTAGRTIDIRLQASDPDGEPLTYKIVSLPRFGTLSGGDDGDEWVGYTAPRCYLGADSFTFKASDGTSDSNTATVSLAMVPVEHVGDWVVCDWWSEPPDAIRVEGDFASPTDGNPSTSFDVVLYQVIGNVRGPRYQVELRPVEGFDHPKPVSEVRIMFHVGGSPVREVDVYLGGSFGTYASWTDLTISDGLVLTWTAPLTMQLDRLYVQIDALQYHDIGAINNPIGFAEIEVTGGTTQFLDFQVSPDSLTLNDGGWYEENPVEASAIVRCPPDQGGPCRGGLVFELGEPDNPSPGDARFYVAQASLLPKEGFTCQVQGPQLVCAEDEGDLLINIQADGRSPTEQYSHRSYRFEAAPLEVSEGASETYSWTIWTQPQEANALGLRVRWVDLAGGERYTESRSVSIPPAHIHPIVFLPGAGATQPPTYNQQLADTVLWAANRAAHYEDLYLALQKMGYEIGKTLFLFPYDWLRSNAEAAPHLLHDRLVPAASIAASVPWVEGAGDPEAVRFDLIGHSTGNLVSRAYIQGDDWAGNVRRFVGIAGPHLGVPRGYRSLEGISPSSDALDLSAYFLWAPLRARQAGYGRVVCDSVLGCRWVWTMEDRYQFAHDPIQGLNILPEFLPTYDDQLSYLVNENGVPPEPSGDFPFQRMANPLLEDEGALDDQRLLDPWEDNTRITVVPAGFETRYYGLNTPDGIERMEDRLHGIASNVCIIYGSGSLRDTTVGFEVDAPAESAPYWLNGRIEADLLGSGDGLVPGISSNPAAIWTSETPQSVDIDTSLAAQGKPEADHARMVGYDVTISQVVRCLTSLDIPQAMLSGYSSGEPTDRTSSGTVFGVGPMADRSLVISAFPDVELTLTNAIGQSLGYNPNGRPFSEIDSGFYVRDTTTRQSYLIVSDPAAGEYVLTSTCLQPSGCDYEALGTFQAGSKVINLFFFKDTIGAGQQPIPLTVPATVEEYPTPPEVEAGPDVTTRVGERVAFSGTVADVNVGDTHSYAWDFGDGTGEQGTLTPTHIYTDLGVYTAMLTVRDGVGFTVSDTVQVTVDASPDTPLVANAGPDQQVAAAGDCLGHVTLDGTASTGPDGVRLTYVWSGPFGTAEGPTVAVNIPLGSHEVVLAIRDDRGRTASDTLVITVEDTTPPHLVAPDPVVVEQTSLDGTRVKLSKPTASDFCDAAPVVTTDAPKVFPLGRTKVRFTATDAWGNRTTSSTTVTVKDTTHPQIRSASANPSVLWPPNHKMLPVRVSVSVKDVCDAKPFCKIESVNSSEPIHGTGKGDGSPDWEITGNLTVNLRAERSPKGNGRVYTITVRCTDDSGNRSTKTTAVTVPDDHGDKEKESARQ